MIEATPQHLLDCVALVYDDLLKRPDFVLELTKSGRSTVYLTNVTLETEGRFTCQVSADEPFFGCVQVHRNISVYVPPEESPEITGEFTDYGENLTLRCLSARSKPAANLSWYINDVMAPARGVGWSHVNSPIARSIQDSLYNTHNIRLGWIRTHVGHLGNEKADELAKEAITSTKTAVLMVPLPRSSAKHDLKQRAQAKWQKRWDDGINGRSTYEVTKKVGIRNRYCPRQLIQFIIGHGHFLYYLFGFGKHPDNCCACGEAGTPLYYDTKWRSRFFTISGIQQINT
ncbi:hypothetical protein AVEN_84588-1 [Araneus ventricosus]|uniref:Ig-like domain-containing protein n=1 Tax=Araneus ventricosus TaxID=182803 RepID=A0A4Y2C376_ARAVE|nr:hypothetical protein AVEN_84588-1 [Araneus ventricosus]